jgi:hypothetical protein
MPLFNRHIEEATLNPWLRFQVGEIRRRPMQQDGYLSGEVTVFHLVGFGSTLEEAEAMALRRNGHKAKEI